MQDFAYSTLSIVHGFARILKHADLRAWSIVPLLVTIILFPLFGVIGIVYVAEFIPLVSGFMTSLLGVSSTGFLGWLIAICLWPIALLALILVSYILIKIIVAPFYSVLAERALVHLGLRADRPFQFAPWLAMSVHMLVVSLVKAVLFAAAGALLFAMSFVPGLNLLATVGFAHILAFDVADYSFEVMEWPLRRRISYFFRENTAAYSGSALGLGVAMFIPGLSLVLLPAAIVGSAEILARTQSKNGAVRVL